MFVVTLGVAPLLTGESESVEQRIFAIGGGGLEFALPYGYVNFLPGVTARASLPLDLHPWKAPVGEEVAAAVRLHWGNRLMIYGGNLSFGGPTSLFTTAAPTMTLNPLASFSFPTATVSVGMPGFSGSTAPYAAAVVASLGRGFAKDRVSLWAVGSEQGRFVVGMGIPFRLGEGALSLSTAAGAWFLEGRLPDLDDSWYSSAPIYGDIWVKGVSLEGRLTWNWLRLYGSGVVLEQPWGGFAYWGRIRMAVDTRVGRLPLRVLAGIYGGLPDSVTANGSVVRETFQAYVNPQLTMELEDWASWLAGGRLRLGLAFGASFKNTNEVRPQLFSDGKLRGGLVAIFPSFRLELTGDWMGIRLSNLSLKDSLRSQERYGGQLRLTLSRVIPRFSLRISGSSHYEDRGGADKDRIVMGGNLSLYQSGGRKNWLFSLMPDLSAATEVVLRPADGFHSAATDAKASWNFQLPYVRVGVWVALELRHNLR